MPFMSSNFINRIFSKPSETEKRNIYINSPQNRKYKSNVVITSKYTKWNFLIKNLYEQFYKLTNLYFLYIVILQSIPQISTTNGVPTILFPLLFVLGLNGIKDAYEDYLRHKSDDIENNQIVYKFPKNFNYNSSANLFANINLSNEVSPHNQYISADLEDNNKTSIVNTNQDLDNSFNNFNLLINNDSQNVNSVSSSFAMSSNNVDTSNIDINFDLNKQTNTITSNSSFNNKNNNNNTNFSYKDINENEILETDEEELKLLAEYKLLSAGLQKTKWKHISVGDIIFCKDYEYFPADIILLASSDEEGIAFVETASLDGETNLKLKHSIQETANLLGKDGDTILSNINKLRGFVRCDPPNKNITNFDSLYYISEDVSPISLSINNILLRGCKQRNTEWLIGMVVYTGHDTKILQNSSRPVRKFSKLDNKTNNITLTIFLLQIILCLFAAYKYSSYTVNDIYRQAKYIGFYHQDYTYINAFIVSYFTWVNMTTNLIPISLVVTISFVKAIQAYWIYRDIEMFDSKLKKAALPRSSDLNEELGQIDYIFSDKTGTLTCNVMKFKKCYINGYRFGETSQNDNSYSIPNRLIKRSSSIFSKHTSYEPLIDIKDDELNAQINNKKHPNYINIKNFFLNLCTNHSLVPEKDKKGHIKYSASSPDEGAFVEAARFFGFEFIDRTPNGIELKISNQHYEIPIMASLEFTSERKRSSIILKFNKNSENPKYILFCKGADISLLPLFNKSHTMDAQALAVIDDYAKEGYRTLCIAQRELTKKEFENWNNIYIKANLCTENRQLQIEKAAELIETDLEFVGVTAVEDRLQEGVEPALTSFKLAGIKVWMLTGDKTETAINIGISTNIIHSETFLLRLTDNIININELNENIDNEMEKIKQEKKLNISKIRCMVVNGHTLWHLLEPNLIKKFLYICENCESVIACRVTPYQKGAIVTAIKAYLNKTTLAIGDGGNDCNMITKADVGIGIRGKEGMQAFNSSDYGISQFRFLKTLILVHGRWSYKRISKMILYAFYKNIVLVIPLFLFGFFSLFSGQKIYYEYLYQLFNLFFTSLSIGALGIFDTDFDRYLCYKYPQIYKLNQKNSSFNIKLTVIWLLTGIIHGTIVFLVPLYGLAEMTVPTSTGETFDLWTVGTAVFTLVMIIVNFKIIIEIDHYWWLMPIAVLIGFLLYVMFLLIFSLWPVFGSQILGIFFKLGSSINFYIVMILSICLCFGCDMIIKSFKLTLSPSVTNYIQHKEYLGIDILKNKKIFGNLPLKKTLTSELHDYVRSNTKGLTGDLSFKDDTSFKGYAFSAPDKESRMYVHSSIRELST